MYGIPLHRNEDNEGSEHSEEFKAFIEDFEGHGIESPYSGAGNISPCGFGITMGGFDDACHHVEVSELQLTPSPEQLVDYLNLVKNIPTEILEEFNGFGPARVFFLASTS